MALNLVLKPLIDELFLSYFSQLALRERDHLLGQIFIPSTKTVVGIATGARR